MLALIYNDELKAFVKNLSEIDTPELEPFLQEGKIIEVTDVLCPSHDPFTQNVSTTAQKVGDDWVQVWTVSEATDEEKTLRVQQYNDRMDSMRIACYKDEADPIFFKMQRGEATQEQWQAKIAEIKARYPKR